MTSAEMFANLRPDDILIAVMGATGTGKSTFIKLLTKDENVVVGHNTESETSDITLSSYIDKDGRTVFLVDTPGFDDSRAGVTDTDILEKIVEFLQPPTGGRKLNGIIYLHRIQDPRVGGVSRKNLRMFKELCGDSQLPNVRIATTFWGKVDKKEGASREKDLAANAFKPLITAGAVLVRHDDTEENARSIVSPLVVKDSVKMQIQEELDQGKKLGETSAGSIIANDIEELQKKHREEMEALKKDMEYAAKEKDEALRAELAKEREVLEQQMARAAEDTKRLQRTLDETRADLQAEATKSEEMRKKPEADAVKFRDQMARAAREREKLAVEMAEAIKKAEVDRQAMNKKAEEERGKHEKHIQTLKEAMAKEASDRAEMQRKMTAAEEKAKADNAGVIRRLEEDRKQQMEQAEKERERQEGHLRKLRAEMDQATADRPKIQKKLDEAEQKEKVENAQMIKRLHDDHVQQLKQAEGERRRHEEYLRSLRQTMEREAQEREEMQRRAIEAQEQAWAKQEADHRLLVAEREKQEQRRRREREQQLGQIEQNKRQLERQANQGMFGKFVNEYTDTVGSCARTGKDTGLGFVGGATGVAVGLALGLVVAGWRTVFGK